MCEECHQGENGIILSQYNRPCESVTNFIHFAHFMLYCILSSCTVWLTIFVLYNFSHVINTLKHRAKVSEVFTTYHQHNASQPITARLIVPVNQSTRESSLPFSFLPGWCLACVVLQSCFICTAFHQLFQCFINIIERYTWKSVQGRLPCVI